MAKILRKVAKIFGSTAGTDEIAEFGSLAAGTPTFTTDPDVIQSLANYLDGWFGAVIGANSPAIEDMNALCFLYAYQLAYLMQAGVAEWNSGTTYYIGSVAQEGGVLYKSLTNDNLNNPLTDSTNWVVFGGSQPSVKTTAYTLSVFDDLVQFDSSGGTFAATFPDAANFKGKTFKLQKIDSSLTPITFVNGPATGRLSTQWEFREYVSDGTDWVLTNWQSDTDVLGYSPVLVGFGTPTNVEFEWGRSRDKLVVTGKFTSGLATAVEARAEFPTGLESADTSKIPTIKLSGYGTYDATSILAATILMEPSVTYFTFGRQDATHAGLVKLVGGDVISPGNSYAFFAEVPIDGWER